MRLVANRLSLLSTTKYDDLTLPKKNITSWFKKSYIITFAIIGLLVGVLLIFSIEKYSSFQISKSYSTASTVPAKKTTVGFNQAVKLSDLNTRVNQIISQPVTLTVGSQTKPVSPDVIKSWLTITQNNKKGEAYIHVSSTAMLESLTSLTSKYVKEPVNQVVVTRPDGSSDIIVNGQNGTQLTEPAAIANQVKKVAKNVLDVKGLSFSTGLAPLQFQSITPASFNKMIEVNLTSKQMYLYDKGNLTRSYPISAGAPATPTPVGQFKITSKFAVQDMRGDNVDGSRYFQPHVRWINYFAAGGYAIHGNYWRPASVFGHANTSHGCVSLPENQAKQVYDWASIGTTVITHN